MLVLTGNTLTLEEVAGIANELKSRVSLADSALPEILASRRVVEEILARDEVVYSINTGLGALSNHKIPANEILQFQKNLVRSHAAGTGPILEIPAVRAMMLLRANTLAKGVSGVRPEVILTLLEMLNRGVHPAIPSQGSLGASGDLAPLAHLALVLMGEGEAFFQGERLPGEPALQQAGIQPLTLQAKEGLALLNGTQMMTAIGTLVLLQAEKLTTLADIAGAMTIEAVQGSHKPFSEKVFQVRPHPGHGQSAQNMRTLLQNSAIATAHAHCTKVQDAYSLRCIPQVHGAVRDLLGMVRKTLAIEINATTDNPLIFSDGTILSQGNFHGEPVAMALDMLGIALAELASISERRIDKLMNPVFSELPAFLVQKGHEGTSSGFMIAHYTAASLVSENKILAHPACVDTIPTSNDKEDHVSMGATAARKAEKILAHTRWVLATELLAAAQGLSFHESLKPGDGVTAALEVIRTASPVIAADRVMSAEVEKIAALIDNGAILNRVVERVGPLT